MSKIENKKEDSILYPIINIQKESTNNQDDNKENITKTNNLKIETNENTEKIIDSKNSPNKNLKCKLSISTRLNSLIHLKRKGSSARSAHSFLMTPLNRRKDKKNESSKKQVVPSSNTTYAQPTRNNKNSLRVNSKLSMNSNPGEPSYFSDASSAHSFISSSTTNSFFSSFCKKKAEKKLKRKDFSDTIKELGSGATGRIHLVYRKDNPDKYYALKEFIIPNHKLTKESERKFFKYLQSEYTIGTILHHRNVIEVESFIYNDYYKRNRKERHVYQVMEYCQGGDLFDLIHNGNLSQGNILCYFKQLMEGLAYIHSMGVAHRDLKPENIMFKDYKILKILDFGAAIMFKTPYSNEIIRCSGIVGSEAYMAPEQFSLKSYDPRTVDIWSCGIIFLAMFYNELPWKSAILSNSKYKAWAEKKKSEIINDLPNGPRQLITRMLEPDPDKRITIEEIFKDKWFKHIYCCQDYENIDYSNYNYSNLSYTPSVINSCLRRNTSDGFQSSNVSTTGRTYMNKGSSIKFSDGILTSDNSITESDEASDSRSILKGNISSSSEKTKVAEESLLSPMSEISNTKKAFFSLDTDSEEEKDSDSPGPSSDASNENKERSPVLKEREEIIKEIDENDEELKSFWGLDLKSYTYYKKKKKSYRISLK
ncbi:Pkinase-domain-containing protein [Neocallimastix sp. 'constans']